MRTVDDLLAEGVAGRFVLVRADLNVPLDDSDTSRPPVIADDGRVRASLPTITRLVAGGAKVLVMAHLGRPTGGAGSADHDPRYSLAPVAARLGELLDARVSLAEDVVGESAHDVAAALADGGVGLLANVRYDPRETGTAGERDQLATELVELVSSGGPAAYVSDGFGVVHREQASVVEVARKLPHYAGDLVARETDVLRSLVGEPDRPYVVVLGGSKVSDKLGVLSTLLPTVDTLLVGGAMCFTFLAAQGHGVGGSRVESDMIDTCRDLLSRYGDTLVLPTDVVVAAEVSADAETRTVGVEAIPEGWIGLDVGPRTVSSFSESLSGAATVFWNGPMGMFELAPFAPGTTGVAEAIAASKAFSVVGGGDSASAIRGAGLADESFGHISTGGGAALEFLQGDTLPGIAVLEEG